MRRPYGPESTSAPIRFTSSSAQCSSSMCARMIRMNCITRFCPSTNRMISASSDPRLLIQPHIKRGLTHSIELFGQSASRGPALKAGEDRVEFPEQGRGGRSVLHFARSLADDGLPTFLYPDENPNEKGLRSICQAARIPAESSPG